MAGDDELGKELRDLTEEVAHLREETIRENELRAKRIATAEKAIEGQRRLARWGIGFGIGGVVVGLIAIVGILLAVSVQTDFQHSTRDARIGSCLQYNDQQDHQGQVEKDEAKNTADHIAPLPRSTAVEEKVQEYIDSQNRLIDKSHPHRLCTPKGIADFLSGKPTKP